MNFLLKTIIHLALAFSALNTQANTMINQCNFEGKLNTFKSLADHVTKDLFSIDDLIQFSVHNGVIYYPSALVVRVEMQAKKGLEEEILDKIHLSKKGPQIIFEVNSFNNVAFRHYTNNEVKIIAEFSLGETQISDSEQKNILTQKAEELSSFLQSEYQGKVKYKYSFAQSVRTVMDGGFKEREKSKSPFKWWVKRPLDLQMKSFDPGKTYYHNGKTVGGLGHDATCEHKENLRTGMELVPSHAPGSKRKLEITIDLEGDYMKDYIERFTKTVGHLVWVQTAEVGIEQARQPNGTCSDQPLPDGRCSLMVYPSTRVVFGIADTASDSEIENILKVSEIFHNYYQVVSRVFTDK